VHVAGGDTTALPGAWAVLHQVGLQEGAPVDSVRTDRSGRYAVGAPSRDTAVSYLVSAQYHGIAYFTEAFAGRAQPPDTFATLVVYDTSSTSPPITLFERHVIVRFGDSDGSRRVVELLVLHNAGDRTRIPPDTGRPVWRLTLPQEAYQLEFGAGDMSEQAIAHRGGRLEVMAAMPPGERQLLVGYLVPASVGTLEFPVDQDVGRLHVLLEDSAAVVEAPLEPRGWENLEGAPFRRFTADGVTAGGEVVVRFGRGTGVPESLVLWIVVPVAALALGVGLWRWWRDMGIDTGTARADEPERLAAEIATLDARAAGRQDEEYRVRRAELKARLTEALARREGQG
jgi:hypothetical protein